LKGEGVSEDIGNGFLFKNYDSGGLWYGLSRSVQFHRRSPEVRERQIKRIMREARKKYDLDSMVDAYVRVYESLNKAPLL